MLCFQKWHKYTVCIIPLEIFCQFFYAYFCNKKRQFTIFAELSIHFFMLWINVIKISLSFSSMLSQISSISFCSSVRFNLLPSSEKKLCDCNFKSITDSFQGRYCRYALLIHYICQRCLRHIRELCKSVFGDFMLAA